MLLIRARLYQDAECELLISDSLPERHSLLLLLRIAQGYLTSLRNLFEDDSFLSKCDKQVVFFARQKLSVFSHDYNKVVELGLLDCGESVLSCWHSLTLADAHLWVGSE